MSVQDWAAGLLGPLAIAGGWRLFKNFAWPRIEAAAIGKGVSFLMAALRGDGVEDADLKAFQHDIALAFVKLAERKLPGSGWGADRAELVKAWISKAFPWLKGHEADIEQMLENAVIRMDKELEALAAKEAKPETK